MADRQVQEGGDNSTNLLAGRDITYGLTLAEGSELFDLKLAQAIRSHELVGAETFNELAAKFAAQVLKQIGDDPDRIAAFRDPDVLIGALDAQKAAARSGRDDLSLLLSSIVAQTTRADLESQERFLLREAIELAPKLSREHIAALCALLVGTVPPPPKDAMRMPSVSDLGEWIDQTIGPFASDLDQANTPRLQQHLLYCRVMERRGGRLDIPSFYTQEFSYLFTWPLNDHQVFALDDLELSSLLWEPEPGQLCLKPVTQAIISQTLESLSDKGRQEFGEIRRAVQMAPEQAGEVMAKQTELWKPLVEWERVHFVDTCLTPVGMTIAHASLVDAGATLPALRECLLFVPF